MFLPIQIKESRLAQTIIVNFVEYTARPTGRLITQQQSTLHTDDTAYHILSCHICCKSSQQNDSIITDMLTYLINGLVSKTELEEQLIVKLTLLFN